MMKKLLFILAFCFSAFATAQCPVGNLTQNAKWRFVFTQCMEDTLVIKYTDTSKIAFIDGNGNLTTITYRALLDSLNVTSSDTITTIEVRDTSDDVVYVFLQMGQSNASGRGEVRRLQNDSFNYWGIKDYPLARTSQPTYDSVPEGVRIYYKGQSQSANLSIDNGVWQDYVAGTNSQGDNALNQFGAELSLSQRIYAATGRPVYIVKAAWGATSLDSSITTSAPGDWLTVNDTIAIQYYLVRAMRDLRVERPYATIKFLGCIWNQGENDAFYGITKPQYKAAFLQFKSYMDSAIVANEPTFTGYQWMLTELNYLPGAAEDSINSALEDIADSLADVEYITTLEYPRKTDLTADEADPLTKGTPNAEGGEDDQHLSYIGQLAIGEKYYDFFIQDSIPTYEFLVQNQVRINATDSNLYFYDTTCACWYPVGGGVTFSTGLTKSGTVVTANISTGISGGQTIYGGTSSGDDLTIQSTTNVTKGHLYFGASQSAFNNTTGYWGFGITTPLYLHHLEQATTGNTTFLGTYSFMTRTNTSGTNNNGVYFRYNEGRLLGAGTHTNSAAGVDFLDVRTTGNGSFVRAHTARLEFNSTGRGTGTAYSSLFVNSSSITIPAAYMMSLGDNGNLSVFVNSGTITNTYGLYIGDITTGTQTNTPFSIFSADANAKNYFSGPALFGTSSTSVPSAAVTITSTTQGFLPPVMTAAQASAIASPAQGLMVFTTDTNGTFTSIGWWGYNGTNWTALH